MSRWYRSYEGTVSDPKLHEVALVAGVSRSVVIATWHSILESCTSTESACFEITPRRVALILAEKSKTIELVFEALGELGLISDSTVTKWNDRQFKSDTSTERVKRFRNKNDTQSETAVKRFGNAPETETETETETEGEEGAPAIANPPVSPPSKLTKKTFGEYHHVKLTEDEHNRLIADFNGKTDALIRSLDEYLQNTGKKYRDHNLTIRNWARRDGLTPKGEESDAWRFRDPVFDPQGATP